MVLPGAYRNALADAFSPTGCAAALAAPCDTEIRLLRRVVARKGSNVKGASRNRQRCLADDFGECRVCMARARDVFGARTELDRNGELRNEIAGARTNDVRAEHAIPIIYVTHTWAEVADRASQVLEIQAGKVARLAATRSIGY